MTGGVGGEGLIPIQDGLKTPTDVFSQNDRPVTRDLNPSIFGYKKITTTKLRLSV